MKRIILILIPILAVSSLSAQTGTGDKWVILLHGLSRTSKSMNKMNCALQDSGFVTINVSYPSGDFPIGELTEKYLNPAVDSCLKASAAEINFVTHSMGGILVRSYFADYQLPVPGRVVMLSPPNHGSELADILSDTFIYRLINGPAGQELKTDSTGPSSLPAANFELGIITGDFSWNPFFSWLIPGVDDGKVSAGSAALEGMADFLIVSSGHSFIMNKREVIEQTINFLKHGSFKH